MKRLLLPLLFIFTMNCYASSSRICYFSLNNKKEFTEMEKFASKLNNVSSEKIEVVEFMTEGSDAEESFLKMVESGTVCDGLVISGHHTGSFGGLRGEGTLDIDFMERLSCDPKYKDFFHKIKALWLQGCRTLGVEKIEALDSADYHADRVYNVREADHLSQNPLEFNVEFSQTLDQDNPLSSRYLRIFPRATTFGWTKTSPGEVSMSERSIPFHIAHLAKMNDDRRSYFDDPTSEFDKRSATKYAEAILSLLNRPEDDTKCGAFEDVAVDAWIAHGNWDKSRRFAFDNPDINAYKSLVTGEYGALWEAKSLECILKGSNNNRDILNAIKKASSDPFLVGFTYNSLFEVLKRASREGNLELYDLVKAELIKSPHFTRFMMGKLASKELGIVRKIEYYAFYKELMGESDSAIEKKINESFVSFMNKDLGDGRNIDFELRDAQMTLAQAMIKHKLASADAITTIVRRTNSDEVLISIVSSLEQYPVESPSSIFNELIKSKNMGILRGTGLAIGSAKISSKERERLISSMVKLHGDRAISGAASALKVSRCGVSDCSKLVIALARSSGDRGRYELANLMGDLEVDFSDVIAKEMASKMTDSRYIGRFASSLGRIKGLGIDTKVEILTELSARPSVSKEKIAEGLESVRGLSSAHLALFDQLSTERKARSHLVTALSNSNLTDQQYRDRFDSLVKNSKGDDKLVEKLAGELIYTSKYSKAERQSMWSTLIDDSEAGEVAYWNIGEKILKLERITSEEVEVLRRIYRSLDQEYFTDSFKDLVTNNKELSPESIASILDK